MSTPGPCTQLIPPTRFRCQISATLRQPLKYRKIERYQKQRTCHPQTTLYAAVSAIMHSALYKLGPNRPRLTRRSYCVPCPVRVIFLFLSSRCLSPGKSRCKSDVARKENRGEMVLESERKRNTSKYRLSYRYRFRVRVCCQLRLTRLLCCEHGRQVFIAPQHSRLHKLHCFAVQEMGARIKQRMKGNQHQPQGLGPHCSVLWRVGLS